MNYALEVASSLDAFDVRALLQLSGELRELGGNPAEWRAHLAASLERLCGAELVVVSELFVQPATPSPHPSCATAVKPLQMLDRGLDESKRAEFFRDIYFSDHASDDTLDALLPLYGTEFTRLRSELVDDKKWARSTIVNDKYRAHNCGEFIMSMAPVQGLGVICSMELFRGWGEKAFTPRDRLLVELIHGELARDWARANKQMPRLTPRQNQVLRRLTEGASEKELAHELGLSAHTVHDHVKAVHKAFNVRSRGELLARYAAIHESPRLRLVIEQV